MELEQGEAEQADSILDQSGGGDRSSELSAVILTLNEENNIVDCISSLRWADRIIVIDCFSEDRTVELARAEGAEVETIKFVNFAQQRNSALEIIQSDWIFFVDADERGSQQLGEEIRSKIDSAENVAWYVPRHNYIFGKVTLGAGWYPDYQLRLFRRGFVHYERPVHEIAVVNGSIGHLSTPLVHINYRDTRHFHDKQRFYTDYDAGILKDKGIHPKPYTFISQPIRHFVWRYFTLKGYKDGLHGLRLCLFMSYYEFEKYRKLNQLWNSV